MEIERSELGRQGERAESELKSWLSMEWNMRGFVMETEGSELGRQGELAESELKSWLSMEWNI